MPHYTYRRKPSPPDVAKEQISPSHEKATPPTEGTGTNPSSAVAIQPTKSVLGDSLPVSDPEYPNPSSFDLVHPLFNVIWDAIKGWDMSRYILSAMEPQQQPKDDRAIEQLCKERDDAEQALSHAYYLVTGKSPEWSNNFGYDEAHEEISEVVNMLKKVVQPRQQPEGGETKDTRGIMQTLARFSVEDGYEKRKALFGAISITVEDLERQRNAALARCGELEKFKAYVHKRLDDGNVPTDPDSPHKAEGCRVGGRLDWLFSKLLAAERERDEANAAIRTLEKLELDRVKHLNRLASWAQQDPTGPRESHQIQSWVLSEIKQALGAQTDITKFEPDYLTLKQERDALRQQLEEAKKDNQTIKSTLENKRRELQMFHRALNETEAKLSQRGTGRLTVLQVKSDVTYFFPATCVDGREEFWEGLTNELNALLTSPWRSVESDPPQEKDADRNGAVLVLFPHGSVQYEPWGVVHKMKTAAGWMPIPPLPAQ